MAKTKDTPLMENENVKEFLSIMKENGKDTSGLAAMFGYVTSMENQLSRAVDELQSMRQELSTMREEQSHPVRTSLQNAAKALESKINETREMLGQLKSKIIEGCKNAVTAFKQNGISALGSIAKFFKIKPLFESLRSNLQHNIKMDKSAIAKIEAISKQYHAIGRDFGNLGRVIVGKKTVRNIKPNGKLAKLAAAPFRQELKSLTHIFHIIAPLGFVVFAADLLWEYFRYGNKAAKRFAPAVVLLAASVVLEVVNYWIKLIGTFTVMFQLGLLCFIVALGIESGRYMREAMRAAAEKLRLEYEIDAAKVRERRLAAENSMLDSLSQMKSDYLANISHEMKTPLTVMSGYAQQTEEEIELGEANEQSRKNLRIIQAEARRLAELAGQVLYSSKNLQTGILITPIKPSDILEHTAAVCAPILAKNKNKLETVCEPDCPNIAANLDMIVQVLVNLGGVD